MNKIVLTGVKETLLIPLYGRAKENEKKTPVLIDKKAVEIVNQIEYDFKSLKNPRIGNIIFSLRAKLIDNFVKDFLAKSNENVALHLGCGLDSRHNRIDNSHVDWYDVDFKEVIDIRRLFFRETENYHLISSSVTDDKWLEKVPKEKKQYIVIAEGLFQYLKEEEIRTLLIRIRDRIGSYTLVFDAISVSAAKNVKNDPSLKKTGAIVHWGIDNPEELTIKWRMKIQLIKEQYFTANEEIKNLDIGTRIIFSIANLFSFIRKYFRLLIYRVD